MKKVKLNLGCGNKLYKSTEDETWINVDVIKPESNETNIITFLTKFNGDQVFSISNINFYESELKNLKDMPDNFADEIHGYHIIEHFFRDEIEPLLDEWYRVLKPNGKIILEQPDIVKCAANMLAGIARGEDLLWHNLGVLGFYGDGSTEEPYMGHKWGWTYETLGIMLENSGFIDIEETPPQKHMKNQRDFRIEGMKPNNE